MIKSTLVSFAQIFLIRIILIRNNGFVKGKIGNLFETQADDGKLSKRGEVFSETVQGENRFGGRNFDQYVGGKTSMRTQGN
jgi:hypothetical protein